MPKGNNTAKKTYTVARAGGLNGAFVADGGTVSLHDRQTKYLRHRLKTDKPAKAVAPKAEKAGK